MATINRQLLAALRTDINAALASVAKKHGISIEAGNASFTPTYATFKLQLAVIGKGGVKSSKEAETLTRLATLWNMQPGDLGKKVMLPWRDGEKYQYEIIGARRKSNAAILCKSIGPDGDGKVYCYRASVVLRALGRKKQADEMQEHGQ